MDVLWIIIDSLSFSATPFCDDGPNTMPNLHDLAESEGIVYKRAYAPGPTSPSSHSAFLTGELPSKTGMHEASPRFDNRFPTIEQQLEDTESFVISSNPFIFNGLAGGFDVQDDLRQRDFMVFDSASDPITHSPERVTESEFQKYLDFVVSDGKPLRSLINGASFKLHQLLGESRQMKDAPLDDQKHQFSKTMVDRIESFQNTSKRDSFILANFMDVHAPLDASDQALDQFASDYTRDQLPIGLSGQEVHKRVKKGESKLGDRMFSLYKSTIWDVDKTVTPLIRNAVEENAIVAVTADHGNWFRRERELDEDRIHVPLILFAPGEPSRTVDKTVNIRSLPRTTMELVKGVDGGFKGRDLTDVTDHGISITELIHDPDSPGSPVDPMGAEERSVQYDIATVKGDTRVDIVNGKTQVRRGNKEIELLKKKIEELKSKGTDIDGQTEQIDDASKEHLQRLGYLE